MRDRKIVENNGVPEYATYADMPDPADYLLLLIKYHKILGLKA
jgi:hypothetical protein